MPLRALASSLLLLHVLSAQDSRPASPPAATELGRVPWRLDFDAALAEAKRKALPVLLLFTEIPGCDTCKGFGSGALSNPLLVDAIESCFVPVVVRNNETGRAQQILDRYAEPGWYNPVVRLLDAAGKDLVPRQEDVFDLHGVAARMVAALRAGKHDVPRFLELIVAESDPRPTETAVFTMHCFWEGEALLGALPGVVATRAAFAGAAEAVEVTFRPSVITRDALVKAATKSSCKPVAIAAGELRIAPATDQKHALAGTPYATLDLSPLQRQRVHAALSAHEDPRDWLSPRQRAQLEREGRPAIR